MTSKTHLENPLAKATLEDRIVGTLVGSALGDAVGLYTEFLTAEQAREAYPSGEFSLLPNATPFKRDFHRMKHRHGEWTDDTDHSLLILLSHLHNGKPDHHDFAARLRIWVEQGLRALDTPPLGLGQTVGGVVRDEGFLKNPHKVAAERWRRSGHKVAANGSLMRTHTLGLAMLHATEEDTFEAAARFSAITHVDPRCVTACMVGTALVRGLILGTVTTAGDVDALVRRAIEAFPRIREIMIKEGVYEDEDPILDEEEFNKHAFAPSLAALELDGRGIGYVLKALGASLIVLRRALSIQPTLYSQATSFQPLITELIMHAGDADTNAVTAGAFLGAWAGYKALPWKGGLRHDAWLLNKATSLCLTLGVKDGHYDGKSDPDTAPDGGRGFLTPEQAKQKFDDIRERMDADMKEILEREEAAAKQGAKRERWLWF